MSKCDEIGKAPERPVSLKVLAQHLGLDPSTISFVQNDARNRSLRNKRTQTIGVMLPELRERYHSQVLSGVADISMQENYFFTVHHRHRKDLVANYPGVLRARGAEALLTIDTHLEVSPPLPTVALRRTRCWPESPTSCWTMSTLPNGPRSSVRLGSSPDRLHSRAVFHLRFVEPLGSDTGVGAGAADQAEVDDSARKEHEYA